MAFEKIKRLAELCHETALHFALEPVFGACAFVAFSTELARS